MAEYTSGPLPALPTRVPRTDPAAAGDGRQPAPNAPVMTATTIARYAT
jgi:hypothetical protein